MQTDYIIVGQGVAGTLLTHFLLEKGKDVVVIDNHHKQAASQLAAGIINPVTGRRYVKSWRIDELLPFAEQTYRTLEQQFNISFYQPIPILRTLFNRQEEEAWLARSADPAYKNYIREEADLGDYASHTTPAFSYGEVGQTAQVDLATLTNAYRNFLLEKKLLRSEKFDLDQLKLLEDQVQYQDITAQKIIFCEGFKAMDNPFFNYLPFIGTKGEVLDIRIPETQFEKILKHRIFIVPQQADLCWIGSTYDWQFEDDKPSEKGKEYLNQRLKDILNVPFEVLKHRAAIRPTVKDRRPFLGLHPEHPQVAIFNGLGTKGASLGPFFAKQMTQFLLGEQPLDKAVDIQRYS